MFWMAGNISICWNSNFYGHLKLIFKKLLMKYPLIALLFTFLSLNAFAQVHVGLSAGPNLSFWTWELKELHYVLGFEPAVGMRTVVLGEWQISPVLGVRAEVGAQVKANKKVRRLVFESDIIAGNFDGTPWTFRENYQYWEGSLLVQLSPFKKFRPLYLLAGGTAGRLENGWNKTSGSEAGNKSSSKTAIDVKDGNWNRAAFAADMGLGVNIPLGKLSILKVEGRFQYGLSQLAQTNDVDARVNSALFTLGYLHRL
jgi:hypothetical protein